MDFEGYPGEPKQFPLGEDPPTHTDARRKPQSTFLAGQYTKTRERTHGQSNRLPRTHCRKRRG
jgi:hypothetical protein